MAESEVKKMHPRDKVRARLDAYIDRLDSIFMTSDSEISAIRAGELLIKIAEVGSIELPPSEPVSVVTADPSKRKPSDNVTPMREAV